MSTWQKFNADSTQYVCKLCVSDNWLNTGQAK